METGRREFLQISAGAWLGRDSVRGVVRGGDVGRIVFCRVSKSNLPEAVDWLRSVFQGALPATISGTTLAYDGFVAEYRQSSEDELVICGAEATLVLDRSGSRRFS